MISEFKKKRHWAVMTKFHNETTKVTVSILSHSERYKVINLSFKQSKAPKKGLSI